MHGAGSVNWMRIKYELNFNFFPETGQMEQGIYTIWLLFLFTLDFYFPILI